MRPDGLRFLLATLALPALAGRATAQYIVGPRDDLARHVDSVFRPFDRTDSPGCVVGAYQHGAIRYARGYGLASLEHGEPLTPRSVLDIGSISKQFTAMAMLLLAGEGKLSLDDPIRKLFPEMPAYADGITWRRALSQTSGLRDLWTVWGQTGRTFAGDTVDALNVIVRSAEPFGFLAVAATAHGAPRWLLVRGGRALADLTDICESLPELLRDDPETVALDEPALELLREVLDAASRAERSLLPRRMQRALAQMRATCDRWAAQCRRRGDEQDAVRWTVLAEAAAGSAEHQPDAYALAEAWLAVVRPRLDDHRRQHRRARYVLLRDIDADLATAPLGIDAVEQECSGLLQELPLGERVRACILGLPSPGTGGGRRAWGLSRST